MNNCVNGSDADWKLLSNMAREFSGSVAFTNLDHASLCQLGKAVSRSSPINRDLQNLMPMLQVLARGADFEIYETVVILDPIQMIDLMSLGNFSDESFSNQSVNALGSCSPVNKAVDEQVTLCVRAAGHDVAGRITPTAPCLKAADSPQVGCFVMRKAWNCSPFFAHDSSMFH